MTRKDRVFVMIDSRSKRYYAGGDPKGKPAWTRNIRRALTMTLEEFARRRERVWRELRCA